MEGIVTVMVTLLPEVTAKANVPRSLHVPFRLGRPLGEPFDFETRKKVVKKLLDVAAMPSGSHEKYAEATGSDNH
ncbi:hypothetical protein [Mesobacillus zeae]|uniref:hypothetical protein n=1 Tax=Mesobacillus zeae TaxID=1917180 RepID=UPI00115CE7FE|nr:hypothetical protein [Mesobacillus zeae]